MSEGGKTRFGVYVVSVLQCCLWINNVMETKQERMKEEKREE
jgi:hypothetical protein